MTPEQGLEQRVAQAGADSRHGGRYNTEGTLAHGGIELKKKKKGATTGTDHHLLSATRGEGMGDQEGVGRGVRREDEVCFLCLLNCLSLSSLAID